MIDLNGLLQFLNLLDPGQGWANPSMNAQVAIVDESGERKVFK